MCLEVIEASEANFESFEGFGGFGTYGNLGRFRRLWKFRQEFRNLTKRFTNHKTVSPKHYEEVLGDIFSITNGYTRLECLLA